MLLRLWLERLVHHTIQCLCQHARAQFGKPIIELRSGFLPPDMGFLTEINRPRIKTFIEKHSADAGSLLAVGDGPMDGSRTPIFRQKRTMKIDAAIARKMQQPPRKDLSVSHYNYQLGRERVDQSL